MTGDLWGAVPGLSTTEALCLLAMGHLEAGARRAAAPDHVAVDEVAAVTGLTAATAGAALRHLAKAGHLAAVPYLATASNGRPCARVGYTAAEVG